jgi:hypothetical protein
MKKVLWGVIIGVVAIVVISVIVLGYLGFVPGVSNIFGSNKPEKLGTTFTQQDYQSAITKSGVQFNNNLATTYLYETTLIIAHYPGDVVKLEQRLLEIAPNEKNKYSRCRDFCRSNSGRNISNQGRSILSST